MQLLKILVSEVMTKNPYTVNIKSPFSLVWETLKDRGIRHLPVVDDERRLRGIITQRDIYKTVSPHRTMEGAYIYDKEELDRYILKHVMKSEVTTVMPEDYLGKVIELMVNFKYGGIPVVNQQNLLVGIVTPIDVLRAISDRMV
ncbi:MAG: CBS domain-containing protein [Candidatus Omnitrophica bacterium]|nr:CBS domain-containing protein [Candidatus Omnitrophota bacterium]